MTRTVIIKGRVVGPQTVELAEPLPEQTREVEVIARVKTPGRGKVSEICAPSPPARAAKKTSTDRSAKSPEAWD